MPLDKLSPGPGMSAADVAAHQSARIRRAMIEIVSEQGYGAVKVREVVELAGVSTRAFYEGFGSKEDCFLHTYELAMRPAAMRLILAQADEPEWRERARLVFAALARELEEGPDAARLVLIDAYAAGATALEMARRAEGAFKGMLAQGLARAPGGIVVPPMIVEGMMAGVAEVARTRLRAGREGELAGLDREMMEWALCYPGKAADELALLDRQTVWRDTRLQAIGASASEAGGEAWAGAGDRALILAAVSRLAANTACAELTASAIRRDAGVSRLAFSSHFDEVEDCLVAAIEARTGAVLAQAGRAQAAGKTWRGGLYRAISALCDEIATDPFLVRICLADEFKSGSPAARARSRLIAAIAEQLSAATSPAGPPNPLVAEATAGASWALFHHHVLRAAHNHASPQVASTLTFIALAPLVGAAKTTAAIRDEQDG